MARVPGRENLLRPRHRRAVPHAAHRPTLPQEQGQGGHEAGAHLHHRAHDQLGHVAGEIQRLEAGDGTPGGVELCRGKLLMVGGVLFSSLSYPSF